MWDASNDFIKKQIQILSLLFEVAKFAVFMKTAGFRLLFYGLLFLLIFFLLDAYQQAFEICWTDCHS